jgi:mitotic spindle assembly checkpoint protein MAD1
MWWQKERKRNISANNTTKLPSSFPPAIMERDIFSLSTRRDVLAGSKRDTLAAELERGRHISFVFYCTFTEWRYKDPQSSTAKRQQKTQAFNTKMSQAAIERQLFAAETLKMELQTKIREKDIYIERLERDRRWFSDREAEEKAEKEKDRMEYEEEKVRVYSDSSLRN